MEAGKRNARWYYYSACANAGLGNNVTAMEHARRAASMEPNNLEYRALVNQLEGMETGISRDREIMKALMRQAETGA